MMQADLLSWQPPAYRPIDTSRQAAEKIKGRSHVLRQRCLEHLQAQGEYGATPDEAAAALGEDILNIRPRFSELRDAGLIYDTGMRRSNAKGNTQRVCRLVTVAHNTLNCHELVEVY